MIDGEVEHILQKIEDGELEINEEELASILEKAISEEAVKTLQSIKENAQEILTKETRERIGFEERNYAVWKEPLDLLELFLLKTIDLGNDFNQKYRPEAAKNNDLVFEALTRLHGRACQVGHEILTLLKCGYAEGANARWRTLHEITVTSYFIKEHGNEMAERYLLYDYIESYRSISEYLRDPELYKRHKQLLGDELPSPEEMKELEEVKNKLCNRFGKEYSQSYGWAADGTKKKMTFQELEKEVGIDHLRPYYKMANISIHAGSKGIMFSLGSPDSTIIPVGPSNMGHADPGMNTVISLLNMTVALLNTRPDIDHIVILNAMSLLADEVKDAFARCHEKTWVEYERRMKIQICKNS